LEEERGFELGIYEHFEAVCHDVGQ